MKSVLTKCFYELCYYISIMIVGFVLFRIVPKSENYNGFNFILFSADELIYLDKWGGISLLFASNQSEKTLLSNQTYVSQYHNKII